MKRLILEVSLKPFWDLTNDGIDLAVRTIIRQWKPLIDRTESVSVLFWASDGTEILDFRGNLADSFEWCKWIGIANKPPFASEGATLHHVPHLYRDNPPVMTYERFRAIIQRFKTLVPAATGKPVTIGATFDPGPEFAESEFKYKRHPEIASGGTMGTGQWVSCDAVLKGDKVAYAAFPDGIADGTTLGTFLGAQSQIYLPAMGFDYLWLSNGFGFAQAAWSVVGKVFDGETFDMQRAPEVNKAILGFWRDFRRECPDIPIETRGSNLSTAMDVSTDATPMREIYTGGFNLIAPPNSPWAALDGDYGLEITGWLSHIAELPENGIIPFRYYIQDPWWLNSPWFDRYGREPHDIYLPLSCGRIAAGGHVQTPDSVALLTIDDSFGITPDELPIEVTPHIMEAFEHAPDSPGLVTWIYPFSEYHDWTFQSPSRANEVFFGDWFMRAAVNQGFPLNTVASTEAFLSSIETKPEIYAESLLVCPAPDNDSKLATALGRHVARGGKVLLYGPLAHTDAALLEILGLTTTTPISGDLDIDIFMPGDDLNVGAYPKRIKLRETLSGGGADTELSPGSQTRVLAEVSKGTQRRVFAAISPQVGGQLAWVRGAFCESISAGHLPVADDPCEWFPAARLMRWTLGQMGSVLRFEKPTLTTGDPVVLAAKRRNAWFFSGFSRSTNVRLKWRLPIGIPIPVGCDVMVDGKLGSIILPRAWHRECRVFVDQGTPGEVTCRETYSGEVGIVRRLLVSGLVNATVTFLPDPETKSNASFRFHAGYLGTGAEIENVDRNSDKIVAHKVNGELLISW